MQNLLSFLARPLVAAGLLAGLTLTATADHHGGDPSGTWTWKRAGRDGGEVTTTLKLKAADGKLTGTVTGRNNTESEISKGTVKGNEVSFEVTREFNGNQFTAKYAGKVEGDTIKGTVTSTRNGEELSREWIATRKTEAASPAGNWKSTFTRQDGSTMELNIGLKLEGEKVTGAVKVNDFEIPLSGTYKAGKLTYRTEVERDGQKWTSEFVGEIKGDKLIGKSTSQFNGQERVRDVEATRLKD
ncbi:MAG TPA: hypothetical protein DCY13_02805 [Verrucomicrobiales bacterium]|nr:hypothetical protein [Verrucomicrobiales bacterium]